MAQRILDAAFEQFCLLGIKRSSMEDVAKKAGIGRVTIYRRFASKDKLVEALMNQQIQRVLARVTEAHAAASDVESAWVAGFVAGMNAVRRHPLLQALLNTEPETILPMFTVKAGPGLSLVRAYLAGEITKTREALGVEGDDADELGEVLARLTLSLVLTPDTVLAVDDEAEAAKFARRFLLPLVTKANAAVPTH